MRVVIIGAGPAGVTVAETLRANDRTIEITMLSSEPFPPYAPPALADHFLTGRDQTLFWKGRDVCDRLGVEYRPGASVSRVDAAARRVLLGDNASLAYDRLVIASGSRLYAPVAGSELAGIANFKSLTAASALVARAKRGLARSAVIVGAGFIGVEVAFLLRDLGLDVTLIEAMDRVMPQVLDRETARIVEAELKRRGVALRLRTKVAAFVGHGRAEHVVLDSHDVASADIFVAATGVKPNVEHLRGSGVLVRWGVLVDDTLCTNVPGIYAAGDVAETRDRMTGERYVHAIFPNAVEQGKIVAHALLGFDVRYEGAESMNSLKHVGVPVIAVGASSGQEELCHRAPGTLRKIFLDDGRIVGFRLAGDISAAGVYRSLMLCRSDVAPFRSRLAQPGFGVGDIVLGSGP